MKLEEYSTAKAALEKGVSVAPNESKFKKMIDECNLRIAGILHKLHSLRLKVLHDFHYLCAPRVRFM